MGIVYIASDVLAGLLMVGFLFGAHHLATRIIGPSAPYDAVAAILVFAIALGVQTKIGHGIFEKGIDDTGKNLAEFRRTRNPIPLILIFQYHLIEVLLAVGYRPRTRDVVQTYRNAEIAALGRGYSMPSPQL